MLSLFSNLRRIKATNVVISSNCRLRNDGRPYAEDLKDSSMADPGVAVYFQYTARPMVMAQDAYNAPFANMRSLALAVEGLRTIERHGGGHMMQRSFEGFAALPPPGGSGGFEKRPWRVVLDQELFVTLPVDKQLILAEAEYKSLARVLHPDAPGGDAEKMAELNIAIEDARQELST